MIDPSFFVYTAIIIALLMLVWDSIEVGRNDAANIVNAVFGARILKRKTAVYVAGFGVIIGAWASSPVMETARSGIFDPSLLTPELALTVYVCVYIADTVLLYTFSSFGMPVSTTAQLIFALLGGAFVLGGPEIINWEISSSVILAIIMSIFISGIASFAVHKIFRRFIGEFAENTESIRRHGPWIAGMLTTGLFFFMVMKGLKGVDTVKSIKAVTIDQYGYLLVLVVLWLGLTLCAWIYCRIGKEKALHALFPCLAVLGMIALAIAFGQNDLANCASPGVASYMIYREGVGAEKVPVPTWLLLGCGILLFISMTTRPAQRVTRAEVNTGSQSDIVRLYAPKWCVRLANLFLLRKKVLKYDPDHLPKDAKQKIQHYDALRAAVITAVSASVIAFASGMGIPVSTTYVTFTAVVATGYADKIFIHGDAAIKLGRTIWVVFTWFTSALLSAVTTGVFVLIVKYTGVAGILICIAANLVVRKWMKDASDRQEEQLQIEAAERKKKILESVASGQTVVYASDSDEDHY